MFPSFWHFVVIGLAIFSVICTTLYCRHLDIQRQIKKKNYERKRKSEKAKGERREINTGCQNMSKDEMYKKYFSILYPQILLFIIRKNVFVHTNF